MATHLRVRKVPNVIASGMPARLIVTACDEAGNGSNNLVFAYSSNVQRLPTCFFTLCRFASSKEWMLIHAAFEKHRTRIRACSHPDLSFRTRMEFRGPAKWPTPKRARIHALIHTVRLYFRHFNWLVPYSRMLHDAREDVSADKLDTDEQLPCLPPCLLHVRWHTVRFHPPSFQAEVCLMVYLFGIARMMAAANHL